MGRMGRIVRTGRILDACGTHGTHGMRGAPDTHGTHNMHDPHGMTACTACTAFTLRTYELQLPDMSLDRVHETYYLDNIEEYGLQDVVGHDGYMDYNETDSAFSWATTACTRTGSTPTRSTSTSARLACTRSTGTPTWSATCAFLNLAKLVLVLSRACLSCSCFV